MGILKKIFKPVSKVLDKIIPNEIKPALPYLAAFAPYMGGMQGIMGQGMMRRALMSGALNIGGQLSQEGSEGDINLLSAGLGALQGAMTSPNFGSKIESLRGMGGYGPDNIASGGMFGGNKYVDKGLEWLGKGSEFMQAPGLKKYAIPATQATGDLMYAQGKRDLKDLANEVVEDMGDGYSDDAYRAAIRKSMEAYGATEEEILESIIAAGYKSGGRVALRGGGVMNAKRGLVDGPGGYAGESQQNRFNFDDTFSLSERLNPRDPENELIAEHMQIGKLPFNITARILELNRGGKSYEDIAEITGVDIEDITSMLEVANNPDIIDPVDRQGKVDYNLWDEIVKERDQIRDRPEHLSYNAQGGRIGYDKGGSTTLDKFALKIYKKSFDELNDEQQNYIHELLLEGHAKGGRIRKDNGGIMDLGGMEKDYRTTGGFVPLGGQERADDVPARLSKNEFVMTADAVRAAGGGSINRGAQRMYDTMKNLEASPQSQRMIA